MKVATTRREASKPRKDEATFLREAVQRLAQVTPKLDVRRDVCKTCGRTMDMNFTDAEVSRQLTRMVADLSDFADMLENGKDLFAMRSERKRAKK